MGCGGGGGSGQVTYWSNLEGSGPQAYFKKNIEKPFEKANQGTDLKVTFQPPDEMDRLVRTALQGGEGPDIIMTPGPAYAQEYIDANLFGELDEYSEQYKWDDKLLVRLGYDAVEVEREPETYDPRRIKKLAEDAGLAVGSVCPNFTAERDLYRPDEDVRNAALAYLREVSGFAAELGAPLFIVAPTAYSRVQPVADPRDEWRWAVGGIRATGEHAAPLGVGLTLECWNRYGTYMLNRLDEGARMWLETGLTDGGIMADTFHMNVEEHSIPGAIRDFRDLLNHVHLSDSNRLAPGLGHVDFTEVLRALRAVGYEGSLAFELIPSLPNILEDEPEQTSLGDVARQAIDHMREVERRLPYGQREMHPA